MSSDKTKQMGTVLYISATLLMRETMETIVPVQGIMVLLLLRYVDVSTNSLASGWSEDDYHMAIGYTILDFVVELFVFVSTVLILRNISDEIKPLRIILGEIHMHSLLIFFLSSLAWLGVLIFQCTHSGVDLSFEFQWINGCNSSNSTTTSKTWIRGYEWECTATP